MLEGLRERVDGNAEGEWAREERGNHQDLTFHKLDGFHGESVGYGNEDLGGTRLLQASQRTRITYMISVVFFYQRIRIMMITN